MNKINQMNEINQINYDIVNNAFSNFMVADMDGPRTETHYMDDYDEAAYYAARGGQRMGAIIAHICKNIAKLDLAIFELQHGTGTVLDEDGEIPVSKAVSTLCCRYQLDEHRDNIIAIFVEQVIKAISHAAENLK